MIATEHFIDQPLSAFSRRKIEGLTRFLTRGLRRHCSIEIPLTHVPSPHMEGLRLVQRGEGPPIDSGMVVGTVRMGYGHHRIAASACSWALSGGIETYLHDLLAIESPEADLIAGIDRSYSRWSRLSADLGGPIEWLWGRFLSQGNLDSLVLSCRLAEELKVLAGGLNKDLPYIASYPLSGQIAVASGFSRVVNLVVDNNPQYFLLVPDAMNLVQSPACYASLRHMGVPSRLLELAGHWVHRDIVANLAADSAARIRRARDRVPLRVALAIGGAGAQRHFVRGLLAEVAEPLRRGQLRIYLNAGDHRDVFEQLSQACQDLGIDCSTVLGLDDLDSFCRKRELSHDDPPGEHALTLFTFERHFEAFTATDRLIRVADVLATKPSELAFIPIPKLLLRRVGDHEGPSALRSAELGDGTPECRTEKQAAAMLALMSEQDDLLVRMNERIMGNAEQGIYDGSKVAVEVARSL